MTDTRASAARDEILARIERALDGAPAPAPAGRGYRTSGDHPPGAPELVTLITDRLRDYHAEVHLVGKDEVAATIADITRTHAGPDARLVVAADFPHGWRSGWNHVEDDQLPAAILDELDGAVTTSAVAIAETGTIILDGGPGQGRRAITLVPDLHVCLVALDQIVHTVPEALARLDPRRPLTLISGPSATSDIELQRVEGVHGPRTLHVLLVAPA
jgi:L-lactate dehydrogenase complex protein LldG